MKKFAVFLCSLATVSAFAGSFTVSLRLGLTPVANPFNNSSNTIDLVFPNSDGSRDGNLVSFYNCSGSFQTVVLDSTSPTHFSNTSGDIVDMSTIPPVIPGRGIFYENNSGAAESVTFTGAVPVAVFPPSSSCGCGQYSFLGAQNTNASSYQDYMGTAPVTGSQVLIYIPGKPGYPLNSTNYNYYTYTNSVWAPANPPLSIGVAAWFYVPCSTNTFVLAGTGDGQGPVNPRGQLTVSGPAGSVAVISATSDFQTWTPILTNPLTGGILNFTDTLATNFPSRFYKVRLQQ